MRAAEECPARPAPVLSEKDAAVHPSEELGQDAASAHGHPSQLAWTVHLDRTNAGARASVQGLSSPGPWEFAFYLMLGRQRQMVRWYSAEPHADFGPLFPGERYHAIAFVRRLGTTDAVFRASEPCFVSDRGYDLTPWKVAVNDHDAYAPGRALLQEPGINRFALDGGHTLDFLTQPDASGGAGRPLLVCFSAAILRSVRAMPLFSGLRMAAELRMDLIAVSDPLLALHPSLTLAWYAGSRRWPDLPARIAALLDDAARMEDRRLILLGGSGGGFASLAVLEHLRSPAAALVWNPQTSISRYNITAASAYARCASEEQDGAGRLDSAADIARALSSAGVTHDLTLAPRASRHPVVYLQNRGDAFHLKNHLEPYATVNGFSIPDLSSGSALDERHCIEIGNWGAGHVSPPRRCLDAVLQALADGRSLPETRDSLRLTSM